MQVNTTSKGAQVRQMFAAIAHRYDLLNHLLSLNTDRRWRRVTAQKLASVLQRPGAVALDLCCGTADLSLALSRHAQVVGLDFCHPMLVRGQEKIASRRARVVLAEGDALSLPFPDGQFDAVTIAFGLRNLDDVTQGLNEMYRMLRPGGAAAILEFSRPVVPVFRQLFAIYFRHVVPRLGAIVSGVNGAYQYLHDSVQSFPDQEQLAAKMRQLGFVNVVYHNLTGGIAALHIGEKP
ncbi:MAG: bifunctional demethylmenaquinone methyltransferase/2-methoxy-6-polyprenyl-1,4-benzoquinol methylase UbiE [Acidobacteriota bacterium]|nr:bifunctional demethylmenaquinone methyltransferase/2-methoxy-6-polyprenyl-1,4-benzoquinol methylase UbiE [Blastocatellia bacterium]MDW8239879.1 bifunctional demethylmenaquinone methyltransferase/2-methoxy-6-polyprenyl-1,4-benzoquinol methylase UbiE [Acidobacteriota bacterium]